MRAHASRSGNDAGAAYDRRIHSDDPDTRGAAANFPAGGSERDFRAILESAHEAFVSMDAGGFVLDWNAEAEATFGWSREEAVGRVLAELIIPERYREAHWQGLQRYTHTGEGPILGQRIEIEALHREGYEFPVELTISVLRAQGGEPYFCALLHDISDRRRAALYVDAQYAVTRSLSEADSEDEAITGLLRTLGARMDWEFGAFWRPDAETGRLVCVHTWTSGDARLERFAAASRALVIHVGEGLPGRVAESRRPEVVPDVRNDERFLRVREAADAGLHAAICFPLLSHGATLGVIEFLSGPLRQADHKLVEALAAIGTQVAQHLTVVRERDGLLSRMEAMALTDELTGLPNRRAWDDGLLRELARAQRHGDRLSVAILDLDHFKRFNDTHGHQVGDSLLREASAAWSAVLRSGDFLARYGGEEFALALPRCPPHPAIDIVDRVRAATPMGETCSAGIARWDGEEPASELLRRADESLYEAKRAGRNRSCEAADR